MEVKIKNEIKVLYQANVNNGMITIIIWYRLIIQNSYQRKIVREIT